MLGVKENCFTPFAIAIISKMLLKKQVNIITSDSYDGKVVVTFYLW